MNTIYVVSTVAIDFGRIPVSVILPQGTKSERVSFLKKENPDSRQVACRVWALE